MQIQIRLLMLIEDFSLYDLLMNSSIADNCEVFFLEKVEDASTSIKANNINVVIIDIDRNKGERFDLLRKLKKSDRLLNVIITGQPLNTNDVMEFINHGALGYLEKPVKLEKLEQILENIAEKSKLRRETFKLEKRLEKKYFFEGMVGKSPHMYEVFSLLETIAPYFSTVLITGETGTGKELIAKAIHNLSPFNKKDLVICDSASIPENLVESELFGYVRGAFTGADRNKPGLFEEANEGIIFLDEIGEIPLTTQAKLLRVLESGQFRPLGSNQITKVNIRIVTATNRDLKELVKSGKFRQDLYHRLNRVEIHLPPLRERPEDISLLIRHMLNAISKKMDKPVYGVSRDVQKLFQKYDWPGNIRELENVLERAAILTKKTFIDLVDLPKDLLNFSESKLKMPFFSKENLATLDEMEKEYITFLLKKTENNLRKTAIVLDISRTTLYNKLKRYDISFRE
jgi:DNA-binding NtrC family response regulator